MGTMFVGIALAFVPTQLPLGLLEGVMTVAAYRFVVSRRPELLAGRMELAVLPEAVG